MNPPPSASERVAYSRACQTTQAVWAPRPPGPAIELRPPTTPLPGTTPVSTLLAHVYTRAPSNRAAFLGFQNSHETSVFWPAAQDVFRGQRRRTDGLAKGRKEV